MLVVTVFFFSSAYLFLTSYNPEADGISSRSSSPSSRSRSPSGAIDEESAAPAHHRHGIPNPTRRGSQHSNSLPFGSAARIGGGRPHLLPAASQRFARGGPPTLEGHRRQSRPLHRVGSEPAPMGRTAIAEEPAEGLRHRDYAVEAKRREAGDVEKGKKLERRVSSSSTESEGPEAPRMCLPVAVAVLLGSTGLACECRAGHPHLMHGLMHDW